jgi:NADH-quinone oxidoreductase subunit G
VRHVHRYLPGALTSGTYRYQTRPWEMQHVGTICTHCSNGCKTTLGVRNDKIVRGNNRDRSGINGEFLCIKGRYGFDFHDHPERLQSPLVRVNGKLEPVSWTQALKTVAQKFQEVKTRAGSFGVIGSNRTTNEENYYLQKFARQVLGTNNIDHHRTGDVVTLLDALSGTTSTLATTGDLYEKKAVLIVGADLATEQPFLSFQIRANYRHHQAHVYVVSSKPVREDAYAVAALRAETGTELAAIESLGDKLRAEPELVIIYGDAIKGDTLRKLVASGTNLGIHVRYVPLVDYSNSRGAVDMGLMPELLPGFQPSGQPGMTVAEMLADEALDVLWVIGANPLKNGGVRAANTFTVVQEMFLTETAQGADVVLPAASAYEKNGTVTNVCGEVQRMRQAAQTMGTKPDLEIIGLIAKDMGAAREMGPWLPDAVFEEIRKNVRGYDVAVATIATGGAAQTMPVNGRIPVESHADLIRSAHDDLFTSGTLARYSRMLNSVLERRHSR